ncbi:MAG: hypothetical protein DRJ14_08080 [Acidobacteria bacterium]|nr:MAG: hypothetical protein DRJ14_08080 [Acidobacteriota bacterium]
MTFIHGVDVVLAVKAPVHYQFNSVKLHKINAGFRSEHRRRRRTEHLSGLRYFFDIFVLLCAILFFMKMVNSAFGRQFYFYYFYFNR